jgi:hypothetical protein
MLVGSNPTEGGGFFEGTSARPWMCVYVYQGLSRVVEGQHGFEKGAWVMLLCMSVNVRWNGRGWPEAPSR